MDEAPNRPLPSLAMLTAVGCILCTLAYLISRDQLKPGCCFPLILTVYGPLLHGADRLFLRRERTMLSLAAVNTAALAAAAGLTLLTGGWPGLAMAVIALLFFLCPTVQAAQLALEPPPMFAQILTADAAFLVLVIFTGYAAATDAPAILCTPICAGCAAALAGLILRRSGGSLGPRGAAAVSAAFAGVFAALWLLVRFVAAPAGGGVVRLWEGVTAAAKALVALLVRLLYLLASLFPEPTYAGEAEIPMELPEIAQAQEAAAELSPGAVIVLAALGIGAALFLAVLLARFLRRLRIGGRTRSGAGAARERSRRPSLLAALRRLASAWRRQAAIRRWLRRHRESPAGVYFLLVRRCRKAPWHKRSGETPREFLTRLGGCVEADEPLRSALSELTGAVDAALYAPCPPEVRVPQAELIRRRTGAAVRRQAFRRRTAALRQRLQSLTRSS